MAPVEDANTHQALAADVNSDLPSPASQPGAPEFVPGEILVGFEGDVPAAYRANGAQAALKAAANVVGANGLHSPRVLMDLPATANRAARVATHWQLPAGADVLETVARLTGRPGIAYAEPNFIQYADATPTDPDFDQLWGLDNTGQTGGTADADIDAPEAWDITTGSGTIVVGVIDTGVDYTHPDLADNMWVNPGEIPGNNSDDDGNGYIDDIYGWDFYNNDADPFDDAGHGSHTSGTIGAVGNNGVGVVGVNWDVQIMALKFLSAGGSGSTDDAVAAVDYATKMRVNHGVNIVLTSNSWGGGGFSQALEDAIAASGAANMLFIASAGNGNTDADANPSYPAAYDVDSIISVAATDDDDARASFSNWGLTTVDLAAPGVSILSTTPANTYSSYSGTSMAAPHVAGAAALAWSIAPSASASDIKAAILDGADLVPSMAGITVTGGRLNAYGTLQEVGMVAIAVSPFAGEIVSPGQPIEFEIRFSHPYNTNSSAGEMVDASDLTVNGIMADSVDLTNSDGVTVTFQYITPPAPATPPVEGVWTMHMAAEVVEAAAGAGLADPLLKAFNAEFRYDAIRLDVYPPAFPVDGSKVTIPFTSVTFDFNEPVKVSTVGTDDVILNQGSVTGFVGTDLDVDSTTYERVQYTFDGIVQEDTLEVAIPAGALTDRFDNPNVAYSGSYDLDWGTFPYPGARLEPEAPLGSLIYDATISGFIGADSDTDTFTLLVDPDQTITVVVHPDDALLAPEVTLSGPGVAVGSVSAGAGQDAVIQTVGPTASDTEDPSAPSTYTIIVGGTPSTSTGAYTLQVILNAAIEVEPNDGTGAMSPDVPQDISGSFIELLPGVTNSPTRGAVLGALTAATKNSAVAPFEDFEFDANLFEIYTEVGNDPSNASVTAAAAHDGEFGLEDRSNYGMGGWLYRDDITVSQGDLISAWVKSAGTPTGRGYFGFGASAAGTLSMQMAPNTNELILGVHRNYKYKDLGVVSQTWEANHWYRMEVSWEIGGNITGRLYDSDGTTLLNTVTGSSTLYISGGIAFRSFDSTKYFDTVEVVPGGAGSTFYTSNPDVYSFELVEGQAATVALTTLGAGDLDLELYGPDPTTEPLYSGDPSPSNVDEVIEFVATSEGTYYARVSGPGSIEGVQYSLVVTRDAALDLEGNDDIASAQDLAGRQVVLGAITHSVAPGSPILEGFEDGNLDEYVVDGGGDPSDNASVTFAAAHDGSYGLEDETNSGDGWLFRDDATVQLEQGDLFSVWVRSQEDPTGRAYFGFGADASGTLSMVMAPNSGTLLIQRNAGYGYLDIGSAPQTWLADQWYRMEVEWKTDGDITGRLYDSDGTTLLNMVTANDTTITSGGIAFRVFSSTKYFDTVQMAGPNPDFYAVTLGAGDTLELATLTPAGAAGEFVNELNPMLRLYNSLGNMEDSDDDSGGDGRNATLSFTAVAEGTYYIEVTASEDPTDDPTKGEYVLTIDVLLAPPSPGITVSPTEGLITYEDPTQGPATFTVVLDTEPTANVTVGITSNDTGEGTVDKSSLTFTGGSSGNWNVPQTVTVTGVDDSDVDGDVAYTILTAAAESTDLDYGGMNVADVSATNLDNETQAGVTVDSISSDTIFAGDTLDVTISGSGFLAGASVTFTSGAGAAPQASSIVVGDGTSITATVTAHKKAKASSWDVVVTNLDGSTASLPGAFTVKLAGTAGSISEPSTGSSFRATSAAEIDAALAAWLDLDSADDDDTDTIAGWLAVDLALMLVE